MDDSRVSALSTPDEAEGRVLSKCDPYHKVMG